MRSEGNDAVVDCDDPVIALACNLDSEDCPAACKNSKDEEKDSDTKVRSGDLEVTAKAAPSTKVLKTGTSDLDTLTFKTSEDVEITKITLERYGYSKEDQITGIWLEDQDGNIIADSKTLSKDKVTLNLKKNYRNVDGKFEATIVVTTSGADGTIGFKVTDVESTAKNLNLDDYNPYTYEVIGYNASDITLELKGSGKTYNYEEGKSYEIGRLKVSAGNSDMIVKGFTLTNNGKVDMKESLDKLVVKVDSKEVEAKYNVNRDDELVVTFNEDVEINMNKKATFVLEASFKDFKDYGSTVEYYVAETSDFNAVEKKNGTRVSLKEANNAATKANVKVYQFNGGKIKISNKKLGNIDAAQGSEGIVVAEGDITVTEPISKVSFTIQASTATNSGAKYIKNMYFVIDGDEYDAKTLTKDSNGLNACAGNVCEFKFDNISIDKSGKIQFKVDIMDPTQGISGSPVIDFKTSFNGDLLTGAKYDNVSKEYVKGSDVAGSISFSKVTIQAAKAALENNLTKNVEFLQNETSRKVVFDGKYTAKKGGDIDLNKFFIYADGGYNPAASNSNKVTFYLFIDGEEVADTTTVNNTGNVKSATTESFSDIRVKAGETVKVKVEAEVEAYGNTGKLPANNKNFRLFIFGTDMSGNEDTGKGEEDLISMEVKAKGSVTIPSNSEAKTALLKGQNITIAKFTVKPSNGNEGITLEELVLSGTIDTGAGAAPIDMSKLRVKVAGVELDDPETATGEVAAAGISTGDYVYSANEEIPSEGVIVEVILKDDLAGEVAIELHSVNKKKFTNSYSKYLVPSLVTFTKQDEGTTSTEYTVKVENDDDSYSVKEFKMFSVCNGTTGQPNWTATDLSGGLIKSLATISDEEQFTIMRGDKAAEICALYYKVSGGDLTTDFEVKLTKKDYKDFFKAGGKELAIPKA